MSASFRCSRTWSSNGMQKATLAKDLARRFFSICFAEYDVEREFRETRMYQVAPISTNMILGYVAEHVLGLPRSY
jgi:hypothetical protein